MYAVVSGFLGFWVSRNLETSGNQQKPGNFFVKLLMTQAVSCSRFPQRSLGCRSPRSRLLTRLRPNIPNAVLYSNYYGVSPSGEKRPPSQCDRNRQPASSLGNKNKAGIITTSSHLSATFSAPVTTSSLSIPLGARVQYYFSTAARASKSGVDLTKPVCRVSLQQQTFSYLPRNLFKLTSY
jgi:hypothetical protein